MAGRGGVGRSLVLIALGPWRRLPLPFAWMLSTSLKPTPECTHSRRPSGRSTQLEAYQAALVGSRNWVLLRNSWACA